MSSAKKTSTLARNFTKGASGQFTGSKGQTVAKIANEISVEESGLDDVEEDATPVELKARDFIEGKIFNSDAKHLPYNTRRVVEGSNSGYRCVSSAVYGTEKHWKTVRRRIANCLRVGLRNGESWIRLIANAKELSRIIEFDEEHAMSESEMTLVAREFECNAAVMTVLKHQALRCDYVSDVIKFGKPRPGDDGIMDSIDHHFQTLVLVKRGIQFELAREISVTTGEVFLTEKRRYEVRRLKKQVSGRNIPALFIEGMNDRAITGANIPRGWAILKTEAEKDHFNGRKLVSGDTRAELMDHCAVEVRKKRQERGR